MNESIRLRRARVLAVDDKPANLVTPDAQMPGMDGFEAAARIKQMPGCADIPIVFITAVYNEDPFIKRGYSSFMTRRSARRWSAISPCASAVSCPPASSRPGHAGSTGTIRNRRWNNHNN